MKNHYAALVAGFTAMTLAGCSGGSLQQSLEPTITVQPSTSSKLQFAVGTANFQGTIGLNAVETYRQASGQYAGASILTNAPSIVGPSGFLVPAAAGGTGGDAGVDAGTGSITGSLQTDVTTSPPVSTFDPTTSSAYLASAWGFIPAALTNSVSTPSLVPGPMPFYAAAAGLTQETYIGGPPAYTPPGHTSTQDGTFPSSYPGYEMGIVNFAATPTSGTYTLNVVVPTGKNTTTGVESYATQSATSTIPTTPITLTAWTSAPVFTADGNGGGTISTNFAGGAGITEEYIEVVDSGNPATGGSGSCDPVGSAPYFYTVSVPVGAATVALPDNIGPAKPGSAQGHTICTAGDNGGGAATGDQVTVYGLAVDYPLYEAGFPASTGTVAPSITSTGTDDITVSGSTTGTADAAGSATAAKYRAPGFIQHSVLRHA